MVRDRGRVPSGRPRKWLEPGGENQIPPSPYRQMFRFPFLTTFYWRSTNSHKMSRLLHHLPIAGGTPAPGRWITFLHGILGQGRNWGSVAARVHEQTPAWGGVLVDLRLHGRSIGFSPPHTLEACAGDVRRLMSQRFGTAAAVLVGHSFGGKVALRVAENPPPGLKQVWVVDVNPGKRLIEVIRAHEIGRVLSALRVYPGPFARRDDAIQLLQRQGLAQGIAVWMGQNLEHGEGGLRWIFSPDEIEELLADFAEQDLWHVVEELREGGPEIHFIRATQSPAISNQTAERIRRAGERGARVFLYPLDGGHWIHVDNREGVVALLTSHLPKSD